MKLRQMQCFITTVDCDFNVARAAATLHATPPAISKQLRLFEAELGFALFLRAGAKFVGLTRSGEKVLRWSRTALNAAKNIRKISEDARTEGRGKVVIATTYTHARYVLLEAIAEFRKRFPLAQFNLLQGTVSSVRKSVLAGKADFGISLESSVPCDVDIVSQPFLELSQVVVAKPGHAILTADCVTLEELAKYPIIANAASMEEVDRKFRDAGLSVDYVLEARDAEVMKSYASAGLGVAIIPAIAYSETTDTLLRARDLRQLFSPLVSSLLLRRESYLTRSALDFLELISPRFNYDTIRSLLDERSSANDCHSLQSA
ncbi:LysR substrate-binding domain-containing protein [Paraburkholderia sp. MM5477-R1]|uniref:LysR substrate-binding domain-containing protein n=1 Tax=Paraburkholderia sp. MM5477-R1 TaxID=2991062 RepID=UPI003D191AC6